MYIFTHSYASFLYKNTPYLFIHLFIYLLPGLEAVLPSNTVLGIGHTRNLSPSAQSCLTYFSETWMLAQTKGTINSSLDPTSVQCVTFDFSKPE